MSDVIEAAEAWSNNWVWSLPLIASTVLAHVAGLVLIQKYTDFVSAMLYSLSAMTSYGHANVYLAEHWQLMGALEALNGVMLFGLTTAFLVSLLQSNWPAQLRTHPRGRY